MFYHRLLTSPRAFLTALLLLTTTLFLTTTYQSTHAIGFITVNTLTDKALNDANIDDGSCSLREAIDNANSDTAKHPDCPAGSGLDTITFSSAGTIKLVAGEIRVSNELVLQGPTIISGDNKSRVFNLNPSAKLTLINLTLQDGFTTGSGGVILNTNSTSEINIIGSAFHNNKAEGNGGAISTVGEINILGSFFVGNEAEEKNPNDAAHGGALRISGSHENQISGTLFNGNIAGDSGGAIYATTGKKLTITDSIFNGNIAQDDDDDFRGGGALYYGSSGGGSDKTVEIKRTAFNGNITPEAAGGAIFGTTNVTINISETTFNGNISGGAAINGRGGAIHNAENLNITTSTFNGNIAAVIGEGGAIYNDKAGMATVSNTSFFGNSAAAGKGGVLYNTDTNNVSSDTTTDMINVTISSNTALEGGAIYNDGERVRLSNTLIEVALGAGGTCAGTTPENVTTNMQYPGTDCGTSIPETDPLLSGPTYNGGALNSLFTIALIAGSPAIDAGDPAVCAADPVNNQDQRGENRPKDGDGNTNPVCDIGAFENDTAMPGFGSNPVNPGPVNFGTTTLGTPITKTISVFETGNYQLELTNFLRSGQHVDDFEINSLTPIFMADGANPREIEMTCTPLAVGTRTATLYFETNDPAYPTVTFDLICEGTPEPAPGFASQPTVPGPVDLGQNYVGFNTGTLIVFEEAGTAPLQITNPQLSGQHAADFAFNSLIFPITINDGDPEVWLDVQCIPTAVGIRQATLTVETNDAAYPTAGFNLLCEGLKPPEIPVGYSEPINLAYAPYAIATSPDNKHIYATVDGTLPGVYAYERQGAGQLTNGLWITHADFVSPRGVTVSPDGKHVYVTDQGSDAIIVFERDDSDGSITYLKTYQDGDKYACLPICATIDGLDGARGVVISPDGKNLYIASIDDDAVTRFDRNTTSGLLSYRGRLKNNENNVTGLDGVRGLAISPEGQHLYATGYLDDTVVLFDRNPLDGAISFVEKYGRTTIGDFPRYLDGAYRITVSPDGLNVYVTSYLDDAIVMFTRDTVNGTLISLGSLLNTDLPDLPIGFAGGIKMSPDGQFAYVNAFGSDTLSIFTRPPAGGALTYFTSYKDGADGVDKLGGSWDVAVSPDGQSVYVTARQDDAVLVFATANPTPVLLSLNPASATAGSPAFLLTVAGESFIEESVIHWNGTPLATTFIDATILKTEISADKISTAGTAEVTVVTPGPIGGTSNALSFTITQPAVGNTPPENPIPSIAGLTPKSALAGSPALTVNIAGSNFITTSQARWNGDDRPTTYISPNQIQMEIAAEDLLNPGPNAVTVFNPPLGGGLSNAATFRIAAPGQNPVPTIISLDPASVTVGGAGGTEFTLTIKGVNFLEDSVAYWNDQPRFTTYVDSTTLQIQVVPLDLATGGVPASIYVINPEPGGGQSNTMPFRIATENENLVPSIVELTATSPKAEGAKYTLTINGSNYMNVSTVWVNGVERPFTFTNNTSLEVQLIEADVSSNLVAVMVSNPAPGGGDSNTMVLRLPEVSLNPVPAIDSLTLSTPPSTTAAFILTVKGSNFMDTSTLQINGVARPFVFVDSHTLRAQLTIADISSGSVTVMVTSPAPGGGQSNLAQMVFTKVYVPLVIRP